MWENFDFYMIQDIIKFTGEINKKINGESEPEEAEDDIDYDSPEIKAQIEAVKNRLNF